MKLKWRVLRLAALSCVVLTSVYAIGNILPWRSVTGSGEGFMLAKPAFAQSADVSFLEQEAGIAAYIYAGHELELAQAKIAFHVIESENQDYLVGSVALPDYPQTEEAHVFIHRSGWVVAYYTKVDLTVKIADPGKGRRTKLELALDKVCAPLGVVTTGVKYYHFGYPSANRITIVYFSQPVRIKIPAEFTTYETSVASKDSRSYSKLPSEALSPDVIHTVASRAFSNFFGTYYNFYVDEKSYASISYNSGGYDYSIIMLVYRE